MHFDVSEKSTGDTSYINKGTVIVLTLKLKLKQ